MRGHLQSTNRRLNRHWQSGGGRGQWEWFDYFITFTSAQRYSNPTITTAPSYKIMQVKRYATFRITTDWAEDSGGNVVAIPDSFMVGSGIDFASIPHGGIWYDVILYKGQDYNPDSTVVNPVTGYTETGVKVPANSHKDFVVDLTSIQNPFTPQDFVRAQVEPIFDGDFIPDYPLSSQYYTKVHGRIGIRFDSRP